MEEQKPQEKLVSLSYVPRDYQIPVLDALENKGYKRVLAILPRRCLSGETHITLANGSYKKLKDIQPGDYILSWNGFKFVPDKVENAWQTDTRLTVELRSYHYLGVISSHEHSFAKTKPDSNIVDWSTVDQLCNDDHLLQYAGCDTDTVGCNELSSLEAELYGYVISSLCSTMRNRISFISTDRSLLERISDIIGQLYDLESSWRESRAIFTIFYTNRIDKQHELFDFLTFTQRAEDYKGSFFSPSLWNLSKKNVQTILYILCSIQSKLLSNGILLQLDNHLNYKWQFYWLFRKIGIVPFVPIRKIDHFELFLPMDSEVRSLLTRGSFHGQESAQEYLLNSPNSSREITKGCYEVPFLLFPSEPEPLYDLETETYGNFLANGYLVHNSGKDITAFNLAIRQCLRKPCVVYYIFPTYAQAKKVIWDSITNEGKRILDFIPPEVIANSNSQEMKIRFINGSLLQLIGSENFDCYDDQTEILTEDGWKLFKDLDHTEKVATLSDGYLVYEKPSAYQCYDYDGELYAVNNESIDFRVTPNHRFWVKSSKGVYKFKEISDPTIQHDMVPSTCQWNGEDRTEFIFPYLKHEWICGKGRKVVKEYSRTMPIEDFVALLGIFLSEGSTYSDYKTYRVSISQTKIDTRKKIKDLLERLGINYQECPSGFTFEDQQLYRYFVQFGKQEDRYVPKDIKALDKKYLQILFDWLVLGDGHKCEKYTAYWSISKHLIDDIQELLIKLGRCGNITTKKQVPHVFKDRVITPKHVLYQIIVRNSKFKRLLGANNKKYIHTESYKGKVYCVSVSSGIIKVRRNGKEMWSGNSIVGTNPQACIFSEYALQDPRAYQFMRPILTANDGWALFLSCVVGNTLVLTRNGLKRICDISSSRSEYTTLNQDIYGLGGFHSASDFYYGGWQPTLRITTSLGTLIECTPIHKLYTGTEWRAAQDLIVGDALPIQCGQNIYGDGIRITFAGSSSTAGCFARTPSLNELMYFFGIFQAHGIIEDNSITIHVLDPEILSFLLSLGFTHHHYQRDFVFHCPILCALMESLGFNNSKIFPTALYQCTKEEFIHFMRGFFDVATVYVKHNLSYVHALSSSVHFLRSLQTVLLNFGIISKVEKKISYQLSIHPLSLARFYYDIGFGLERKQAHRSLLTPPYDATNPHITTDSLGNHYHTVLIDKILPSHAEVYDFVIPDTHSFFSNGLISHNTPRGKNHLWDLYQIAKQSPLWFCYKQTVEDTKHISLEAIEQERIEGIMSEDLIQQEYYTSFTMGVEGAYYLKYFDKLRLNNQIGNVAWEPSFPVNTSWDLGVRDSTAIIFYQVVGQAIHIIDCYENTKEGLEHYIKILKEKPYQYGKHTAPHDIRVREFSSGITRLDKARHLGINFIIAPNIPVMDGIEQVRTILPRCWFDQTKCAQLIKSLENYRQEYDNKRKVYHNQPLHDQWSNFADSMRYLALTLPKTKDTTSAQELEQRYRSAMYGEENLPDFFR